MTKFIAAVLLGFGLVVAGVSERAEAQGVNLQFGAPLGNFTARPNSPGSKGYYGAKSTYANSAAQKKARAISQARAKARAQDKQRALAAKHRAPANPTTAAAKVDVTPAAPSIVVPPTPEAVSKTVTVDPTPAETIVAKDLPPPPASEAAGAVAAGDGKQVCRKYSAAVGAVIETACD